VIRELKAWPFFLKISSFFFL